MANEFVVRSYMQVLSVAAGATEDRALVLSSNGNVATRNITDFGSFSGYSGYSGVSGYSGASGASGTSGRSGYPAANSFRWSYEGLVTSPASNNFGLDNAAFGGVNMVYVNITSLVGNDMSSWIDTAMNHANFNPGKLVLKITKQGDNSIYGVYLVEYVTDVDTVYVFRVDQVLAANSSASVGAEYSISWMRLGEDGKYGGGVMNYYCNVPWNANSVTILLSNGTSVVEPFILPKAAAFDFVRLMGLYTQTGSTTLATSANQNLLGQHGTTWYVGIYTRGDGLSTAGLGQLNLVVSSSNYVAASHSLSANAAVGSYWTLSRSYYYPANGSTWLYNPAPISASYTNISLGSASLTAFTGTQFIDVQMRTTLPEGNYWMVVGRQQGTTTNATNATGLSRLYVSDNACVYGLSQNSSLPGLMGQIAALNYPMFIGQGIYLAVTTNLPSAIAMTNIFASGGNNVVSFQMIKNTAP